MIGVRKQVLKQPGLMNMDTVVDTKDPNCYAVITEWESKQHLNVWLKSDLCKDVSDRLKTVLKRPTKHREFREAEEDIFLL
jgi:heme-degrading monooxygenase HmoA